MPRPKVAGAAEPKKRSRTGCWTCKAKKVKCGEEKPRCANCEKNGEPNCDYSIRLNWEGRTKRKANELTPEPSHQGSGGGIGGLQMISCYSPISSPPKVKDEANPFNLIDPSPKIPGLSASTSAFSSYSPTQKRFGDSSRPSSAESSLYNSPSGSVPNSAGLQPTMMLPPFSPQATSFQCGRSDGSGFQTISEHQDKKLRLNSTFHTQFKTHTSDYASSRGYAPPLSTTSDPHSSISKQSQLSISSLTYDPIHANANLPLIPSTSSLNSEEVSPGTQAKVSPAEHDDPRRLSVNSLLVQEENAKGERDPRSAKSYVITYGTDRGLPDLDIPRNDDSHVLDVVTPTITNHGIIDDSTDVSTEFGFGLYGISAQNKVNGYSEPIPVNISRSLLPLPALLLDNPMNMMYFHFFQEFTARILVPHDCPENPFKIILPQMAVRDDNLLHLLLAYSASHRARLLGHPEPANRIAVWVRDVFPNLRHALDDTAGQISNTNLATAIMLASLEIIAPNTFEVAVPWQDHLAIARRMIIARGGPRAVNRAKDRVSYFLVRWFAYLDVLGNFSATGVQPDHAMFSGDLYDFGGNDDFQIDCVLGFSGHLASMLAQIADLARLCDQERIDASGNIYEAWQPSSKIITEAERIKLDLQASQYQRFILCPHRQPGSEMEIAWESMEMSATNEAFLWAGLIHLHRRVFGRSKDSPEVQMAVREVLGTMVKVRNGGSAEAGLLFPLFTAGCEVTESSQRDIISERIKSMEGSGMTQVHKARRLMELVWETGRPWETLVQGEFFG